MAYEDSKWPCVGELSIMSISSKEKQITWDIAEFLNIFGRNEKEVKSKNFTVAGATWNFFSDYRYYEKSCLSRYKFGINVRTSDAQFESCCNVSFEDDDTVKKMKFNLNCEKADTHWVADKFLSHPQIVRFLQYGKKIICKISIENSSDDETCFLNEYKDISENPVYKLCQDYKQLLLSEEDSDVTFQVGNQQFKAHRAILKARSSVFAAMFHHDMEEKIMGVVNIEDCEPSSFRVLLEFLYCGSIETLSVENMFSAYKSADRYDVQDLKMKCFQFIQNDMKKKALSMNVEKCDTFAVFLEYMYSGSTEKFSVGNVFTLYKYGDKYDLQELKSKCVEFIKNNLSVENFEKLMSSC